MQPHRLQLIPRPAARPRAAASSALHPDVSPGAHALGWNRGPGPGIIDLCMCLGRPSTRCRHGTSRTVSARMSPQAAAGLARTLSKESPPNVAVKNRLKRTGKIRAPFYSVVVADSRTKRDVALHEEI